MKTRKKKAACLQYAFFIDKRENLIPCDEATKLFMEETGFKQKYAQFLSMKMHTTITNSTTIIDNDSYMVRITPISTSDGLAFAEDFELEYILILQNQAYFSYIIQSLNKANLDTESLISLFELFANGIFITNDKQKILFISKEYENLTGLRYDDVVGKQLRDFSSKGFLNPLITPAILEKKRDLTCLQSIGNGHYAIISGAPIYNSLGEVGMVVTCINAVTNTEYIMAHQSVSGGEEDAAAGGDTNLDIVIESEAMRSVLQESIKVARYNVPVLILGESGTGKEIIASIICSASQRRAKPFVKINCSVLSPQLLESELFGYEPGSFTGALNKGKPGLFEVANKGTLLLDEIGDMPIELQVKLLRVLDSGEFYRIGGVRPIEVDVRILAATNKNPLQLVEQGKFREDLFYRLNAVSLNLPALRERKRDIRPLLEHYLYLSNKQFGTDKKFSDRLIAVLENYEWPGNVRELKNLVRRLMILCNEEVLLPNHFYSKYQYEYESAKRQRIMVEGVMTLKEGVDQVEKQLLLKAIQTSKNTRDAARLLDVSQSTIVRKMKEHHIKDIT